MAEEDEFLEKLPRWAMILRELYLENEKRQQRTYSKRL
jgi:hypothetical protein